MVVNNTAIGIQSSYFGGRERHIYVDIFQYRDYIEVAKLRGARNINPHEQHLKALEPFFLKYMNS